MIIKTGEKLHIVIRRLFETDIRRHFIGVVVEAAGSTVRLQGYAVILDKNSNQFVRKPELRTTVMDLAESGYFVNVLPPEIDISNLTYTYSSEKKLTLSDGAAFNLDINEFGINR